MVVIQYNYVLVSCIFLLHIFVLTFAVFFTFYTLYKYIYDFFVTFCNKAGHNTTVIYALSILFLLKLFAIRNKISHQYQWKES